MAKKILTLLVDDLDGTELGDKGHTVEFGWLGQSYEIDLSDANAAAMKDALGRYVEHARRAGRSTSSGRQRSASRGGSSDTKAARAWLVEHGHMSADSRGRIPEAMWEVYRSRGQMTTADAMPAAEVEPPAEKPARTRGRNSRSAEQASAGVETPESVPA